MSSIFKRVVLSIAMICVLFGSSLLQAGNDSSIKGELRSNIKASMNQYIDGQMIKGRMYLFDGVQGALLKMELVELHEGIVKKGDFYVSCADFIDQHGNPVDVDFLVRSRVGRLVTMQAIVHSFDGSKRKYHLEKL